MTDSPAAAATADLLSLADEVWTGLMTAQPIYATAIGDRRFLDGLPPNDAGAIDRERRRLSEQLDRTRDIAPDGLTPADRVTRDALVDTLAFELGVVESGVARWAVDPLDGPQVTFLNIPSIQPLSTVKDGEALLARWREMGPWIDRHVAGLRAAARDGLVAPRALVDSVVSELDDLRRFRRHPNRFGQEPWRLTTECDASLQGHRAGSLPQPERRPIRPTPPAVHATTPANRPVSPRHTPPRAGRATPQAETSALTPSSAREN